MGRGKRPPATTTASAMRSMKGRLVPPAGERGAFLVYVAMILTVGAIVIGVALVS